MRIRGRRCTRTETQQGASRSPLGETSALVCGCLRRLCFPLTLLLLVIPPSCAWASQKQTSPRPHSAGAYASTASPPCSPLSAFSCISEDSHSERQSQRCESPLPFSSDSSNTPNAQQSHTNENALPSGLSSGHPALSPQDSAACRGWVEKRLASMSLKEKIGQLIIHTAAPTTDKPNKDNIRQAVKDFAVGGLLFSGGQLMNQAELTNWTQDMAKIPLIIAFDGEWGLAMRLKGTPSFPRNRIIGCISSDTLVYLYGREVARELRELGVSVNFAPVADVDNNPRNPVINTRSFGSSPQEVGRKVTAYSRGLQDGGVLAVCKHFPGHGDTDTDSHHALPVLKFDRPRLDSIELRPFREAIRTGVGGVMVGHLLIPSISRETASVSREIVTGMLREELGFGGLIFTDALEMKGVSATPDVSAQALIAGCDMVLAKRSLKAEISGIVKAVKDGRLTEEEITGKCRRVLTYKYVLGLHHRTPIDMEGLAGRISSTEADSLMTTLRQAAVVMLKAPDRPVPLDLSPPGGTIVLSLAADAAVTEPFCEALRTSMEVTVIRGGAFSLPTLRAKLSRAGQVIVAVSQDQCATYAPLLRETAAAKPVAIVSFRPQSVLKQLAPAFPDASVVMLAHSGEDEVQEFAALALTGLAEANGRLSVGFDIFPTGASSRTSRRHLIGPPEYTDPLEIPQSSTRPFRMDREVLSEIDSIAAEGIRQKAFPGCQVLILKDGKPVYDKCFGTYTYQDTTRINDGSIYDIASLSKVTGTLLAVMKLYDEGRFALTDKISKYLPWLKGTNKAGISIESLLFHQSGIQAYLPFYQEAVDKASCTGGLIRARRDRHHQLQIAAREFICTDYVFKPEWVSAEKHGKYSFPLNDSLYLNADYRLQILDQIAKSPLKARTYRYSCPGFMLLKEMVEAMTGKPMDEYLDSTFYCPMGLRHTAYCPLRRFPREEIVPTVERDFLRRGEVRGYVHDEGAALMGGVSGNAGLFSNAHDVAAIFQLFLNKGVYGDRRYLSTATCELFTKSKSRISRRALGFDKSVAGSTTGPCSENAPAGVFGHTGFTGTCAWADPKNGLVFVFLSNRTWPQVYGARALNRLKIRMRMQEVMYKSIVLAEAE